MADGVVPLIWEVLGEDRVTTREATERLDHLFGYRCPDDLAKTLNKLRRNGLIMGEVSVERGGWVWWVDSGCRGRAGGCDESEK